MMNAHTFNTPEVIAAARQYREAKRQWDAFVALNTEDSEQADALITVLLDAEEALGDAAMERLQAVATPEQLAQVRRIVGTEHFVDRVATYALA